MALPKRRKSHAKVRTKRAQWKAKTLTLNSCNTCGSVSLPHRACLKCGFYNGRAVVPPKSKATPRDDA
jgi:large subunit ribosomal protein L32